MKRLEESVRNIMYRKSKELNDNTDLQTSLLDLLFQKECITRRQAERLKSCKMPHEANSILYDIMSRKSVAQFRIFLDCLKETDQQHVVDLLTPQPGFFLTDVHLLSFVSLS